MTEASLLSSQISSSIIYRLYLDTDSEYLISLEDEAPQGPFFRTIHRDSYDFRCKAFNEYVILVAEDTNRPLHSPKIIAGVCAGIKNIYLQGQKVKAAIIFDLRVSSKYQRRGIGESICKRLEEECLKRGVEFVYLSVNANNDKAIFLYKKLGYEIFSNRKYDVFKIKAQGDMIFNLKKTVQVGNDEYTLEYVNLSKEEAIKLYSSQYDKKDLAPCSHEDWSDLVHQQNFKGTFLVRTSDNKNKVGMAITKFPYSGFMGIKKVLFPTSFYNSRVFPAIVISLILFGLLGPWQSLQTSIASLDLGDFINWLLRFVSFIVGFGMIVYFFMYLREIFLRFAGFENKGRLIGPFEELANPGLRKEMFEFLMYHIHRSASNEKLSSVVYNRDIHDRFFEHIVENPGKLPEKKFMGRYLKNSPNRSLKDYRPTDDIFFDFRDV